MTDVFLYCAGTGRAAAPALHRSSLQGTRLTVPHARASCSPRQQRLTVKAAQTLGGKKVNKVVLAYSGGLDTSVILTWLKQTYDCEVVTFTADLGQVGYDVLTAKCLSSADASAMFACTVFALQVDTTNGSSHPTSCLAAACRVRN